MMEAKVLTTDGFRMFSAIESSKDGVAARMAKGLSLARREGVNDNSQDGGEASAHTAFDVARGERNNIRRILADYEIHKFNPALCRECLQILSYVLMEETTVNANGEASDKMEYVVWHIVGHQEAHFMEKIPGVVFRSYDTPVVQELFACIVGDFTRYPKPGGPTGVCVVYKIIGLSDTLEGIRKLEEREQQFEATC